MNPFTKYLSQWSDDRKFAAFVEQWDRLERLVIGVYKGRLDAGAAQADFDEVWSWLRERYSDVEPTLRRYWPETRAAGEPTHTDPFQLLLDIPRAASIPGDWRAMQHLPAAREAINRYLVKQGK